MEGFHCVNDFVMMERDEFVSTGGIVLPDGAELEQNELNGRCVGVGDGVLCENGERASMLAVLGQRYKYLTYTKRVVKLNGKEYDLIRDRDLVGFYGE